MQFRFYIINLTDEYEFEVFGTNDENTARAIQEIEDLLVIDSKRAVVLSSNKDEPIRETP